MCAHPPVLYAEDDPNDALFLTLAFEEAGIPNPLIVLKNGAEVIDYLRQQPEHPLLACLLLTDLKMPKVDGFRLLAWVQQQPHFRTLPTLVLSASADQHDWLRSLSLGAREYLLKPLTMAERVRLAHYLRLAWLSPATHAEREAAAARTQLVARKAPRPRILLRQGETYLQPSGQWGARRTAQEFASSTLAYWCAVEQSLPQPEVMLAFEDSAQDFVVGRLPPSLSL